MNPQKIVFCSEAFILDHLYSNGTIGPDDAVFSESPSVHQHYPKTISVNDRASPQKLTQLTKDIDDLCVSIYQALLQAGYEYDSYVIMFQIICMQNFLSKALCVRAEDFEKDVLIAEYALESDVNPFRNHYTTLFRNHHNVQTVKVKKPPLLNQGSKIHTKTNQFTDFIKAFSTNIFIYPIETILWPVFKRIWPLLSFTNIPGIAIIEESQIIRAIATRLSLNRYGFKQVKNELLFNIKKNTPKYKQDAELRFQIISEIIENKIKSFVTKAVIPEVRNIVFEHLWSGIKQAFILYFISYKTSLDYIDSALKNKKAILSNMLKNPEEYGLAIACREKGITVITAQHGICREISPHFDQLPHITESNLAHYFLCNTIKAGEVSTGLLYSKAQAVPIGITKDYYYGSQYVPSKEFPEIFYVSTNVYNGSSSLIRGGGDDKMRFENELFIINNICAPVNKKLLYKAYPSQRYIEEDPCLKEVRKHKNLVLFNQKTDLRFISKYARVFVSTCATSTFNWCFLTGKPFIFLDHPHIAPLRTELVQQFKDMLFYFDLNENNIEDKILALLNLPINEIERLYHDPSKSQAREQFIQTVYFKEKNGAEERAYKFVKKILQGNYSK